MKLSQSRGRRGRRAHGRAARLLRRGATVISSAMIASGCGAVATSVGRAGPRSGATDRYEVLLIPEINAGWAGWCFVAVGVEGGACGNGENHAPVIGENWHGGEEPPETVGVAVTTNQVARVQIGHGNRSVATRVDDGKSVPTRGERRLPPGLRVVVIKIDGPHLGGAYFIPLSADGAVIPQAPGETASQLIQAIPTRRVSHPAEPSPGICELEMGARPRDLSATRGRVITEIHSYSGFVGDGFITCASTSYELAGWPLLATVLISASHPGASPPPLPAMKPLPGHPDVFTTPGGERPGPEGELYARRVEGGWLVVSKAKSAQRLALLKDLRVTIHP
jgi:hypothetical protein